jgi:hypothetical protein
MRNYHIVLANGMERNVKAEHVRVEAAGALVFMHGKDTILAYAAGVWTAVEVERLDDKD